MFIYILLKIILRAYGVYGKKDYKYLFMLIESIIIIGYFYLLYGNQINVNKYLLIGCLGGIIFFISYKSMNYLLENRVKILEKMKKRIKEKKIEKIKQFFLKSIVCDVIYYGIGMLPGNMGYGIYFYIMEHGGYGRVGINSTRDVILFKLFKWDSRNFFFKLNSKIYENKVMMIIGEIKDEIISGILRILLVISYLRKSFLKMTIIEYLMNRILVFCYLSMFYLYMVEGIQIINKGILFGFVFIYILILFLLGFFVSVLVKEKNNKYGKFFVIIFGVEYMSLVVDPLFHNSYIVSRLPFEQNNMVGNKILGNSVSLNILYEYMLYVNKNTKGYYYYKYGILTKIKSVKLFEVSNIPGDIIPKTRYIMMSMRYVRQSLFFKFHSDANEMERLSYKIHYKVFDDSFFMENFIIRNNKNAYLSFTEKTYNDVSYLYTVYLLKLNYDINYMLTYTHYYSKIGRELIKDKKYYLFRDLLLRKILYKIIIGKICLIDVHIKDSKLLDITFILYLFHYKMRNYDLISYYLVQLKNMNDDVFDNISKTEIKYASLKKYKENIKILTHFMFGEEEGIVGNEDMMKFLNGIEKLKQNEEIKKEYKEILVELVGFFEVINVGCPQGWIPDSETLIQLFGEYGLGFNFDINELTKDEDFTFSNTIQLKVLGCKILEMKNEFTEKGILNELENMIKDLEKFNMDENGNQGLGLQYYFKEVVDKGYEKYIKEQEEREQKKKKESKN